jgi:uncharacterized repeat protein (TIGR03803 family)
MQEDLPVLLPPWRLAILTPPGSPQVLLRRDGRPVKKTEPRHLFLAKSQQLLDGSDLAGDDDVLPVFPWTGLRMLFSKCIKQKPLRQSKRYRCRLYLEPLEARLTPSYALTDLTSFVNTMGLNPQAGLISDSNGNLYGTTLHGGTSNDGTLFEWVKSTGSTVILANFSADTGSHPWGTLIADSNGDLFGTTNAGGAFRYGTIFEWVKSTGLLRVLTSFTISTGVEPAAGLIEDNSGYLYGTTSGLGPGSAGTLFELVKNTNTITILANFNWTNGATPQGQLIADSNGNLFGTTSGGGTNNGGTLFEWVKSSGALSVRANFDSTTGAYPYGKLVSDSSGNLYGTTQQGGTNNSGTIFKWTASTGTISTLATFSGSTGTSPDAGLVMDGSGNLYGTAAYGGSSGHGAVFEWVKSSGTLTALASFTGAGGSLPMADLLADSNGNLFGTTTYGGASDQGTVFEWNKSTGTLLDLADFGYSSAANPHAPVLMDGNGNLFGTTQSGGPYGDGTLFEWVKNTGTLSILGVFNGANGADPSAGLVEDSSGNLFGTTSGTDPYYYGTLFEWVKSTNTITVLANLSYPLGDLLQDSSGNIFGTTNSTIFEWNISTGILSTLASFQSSNAAGPRGSLVEDGSGNLYGVTVGGGSGGGGTIYEWVKSTGTISILANFDGTNGYNPVGGLIADTNGNLFGAADSGGTNGRGTLFEWVKNTGTLSVLANFDFSNGSNPDGALLEDSAGNLFGAASWGGMNNNPGYFSGTIFEWVKATGTLSVLAGFQGTDGQTPLSGLVADSSGNLFGTTYVGGNGYGTVFELQEVNPDINANMGSLPANASTLTITGTGFDPTPSNDSVALSSGATGIVTGATSTQLTVTLTSPPAAGPLTAVVTIDGTSTSEVQVASVIPVVTVSNGFISAGASTLTIDGFGFDPTAANNTVTFDLGAAGIVTSATSTQLTVLLTTPPTTGSLHAVVTIDGISASEAPVASVMPVVTASNGSIFVGASTLTINGFGFDPNAANDTVTLDLGAAGVVTSATSTQLTVLLTTPPAKGSLHAVVTIDGESSAFTQVATVLSPPFITANNGYISVSASTLTIDGFGFDPNAANDTVTFDLGAAGVVTSATSTQLTVLLTTPPATGSLHAVVTIDGESSPSTQVATVVAPPSITASAAPQYLPGQLTITGFGFDTFAANNIVAFSSGAGIVTAATPTSLTVTFTAMPTAGVLYAFVVTDGLSCVGLVPVATVVPTVNSTTGNLAATATTLIIAGRGFDPIVSHDLIVLSSGSGTVTAATSTQLTVTLASPPAIGTLSAIVVVNGFYSNALTQVANVVAGTASAAASLVIVPASFVAGSTTVTLQARDALGNNETAGGLKVTFALAVGSAGGTLGAVKDNHNGTYTALFASKAMGSDTFTATLGGVKVLSLASTNEVFDTSFAGGSGTKLATPWTIRAGGFTLNGSGTAIASALAANIATYTGTARGNVSESVTVSNLSSLAVGGKVALIARYAGNANMYLAGIQHTKNGFIAVIQKNVAGIVTTLNLLPPTVTPSTSDVLQFEAVGPSLRLFFNGTLVATATDTRFTAGAVGIWGSAGSRFSTNFTASAVTLQNAVLPFSDGFATTSDGQLSSFWTNQLDDFGVSNSQALGNAALNLATVNGVLTANPTESMIVDEAGANQSAWLVARYQNNGTMYFAGITAGATPGTATAEIWRVVGGVKKLLKSASITFNAGDTMTFHVSGTSLQLVVGSNLALTATDGSITTAGRVGIRTTASVQVSGFNVH